MRSPGFRSTALFCCVLVLNVPFAPRARAEDSFAITLAKAAGSSAAGKGAEFAVKRTFPFGSFLAVQRAGGTYALASGSWKRSGEPRRFQEGGGQRENVRWDWTITTDRSGGAPWTSLLSEGDGEYKVSNFSSRIRNWDQIYLYDDKQIYFPEGGPVKLNLLQNNDCARVCRGTDGSSNVVMDYDVWNNDSESKRGTMEASVAIFFHP